MVELKAQSPLEGQSALDFGGTQITMAAPDSVQSIMPNKGREVDVSGALSEAVGVPLSQVGCMRMRGGVEVIWTGVNQWFVIGGKGVSGLDGAAITDQTDAWAVMELRGVASRDVMARLCPIDLRHLMIGQVARSEFAHMMSIIVAREGGFDIWVMRSFAQTAWHHLGDAASSVAAQSDFRS